MARRFYMVGGPMGVGKSTVCRILRDRLDSCAFLDGDWCWDMHPFRVTESTRAMVLDNICHVLGNFLACPELQNVVFCWVLHEQEIIDGILRRLPLEQVQVRCISLVCGEAELRSRLQKDVAAGVRSADVIGRSLARLPLYAGLGALMLDVSRGTPEEAAARGGARA